MATLLRPVTPDFLEQAPARLVFVARLRAKPDEVFRELTDDASTWPLWFREVGSAAYTDPPPYGPGTRRAVSLRGGAHFAETVVLWEAPERFAYRVDRANVPGVTAWMEEWLLTPSPSGSGTVLRFTMAFDAAPPVRALLRLSRPAVARAVRLATVRLDARCGAVG